MGARSGTTPLSREAAVRPQLGQTESGARLMLLPRFGRRALPGLMRLLLALALALSSGLLSQGARPAQAAAGDLDPTFGTGGKVITDFGGADVGRAIAVQADGKVVVAGSTGPRENLPGNFFALARYLPSGALDSTFGSGGRVTTDFGANEWANTLVVQPDGKLIAAGGRSAGLAGAFALARYLPNGGLDASFGIGGRVLTEFAGRPEFNALALQADGRLVAAGVRAYNPSRPPDIALARYHQDGSLDSAFGDGGKATMDLGLGEAAFAVAAQADGKFVIAGVRSDDVQHVVPPLPGDIVLARFLSGGAGGSGLGLSPEAARVRLSWTGGGDQLGYLVVRDPDSSAILPAGATEFTDMAPAQPPNLNCYVLVLQ
jgi:uncharacterized delta-60 repeat protein